MNSQWLPFGRRGPSRSSKTKKKSLPPFFRHKLPCPSEYYKHRVKALSKRASGWAQGRCPFHDDGTASLSVHLVSGGWRCFAGCGSGDLLAFHMRLTGLEFADAVRDLVGGVR